VWNGTAWTLGTAPGDNWGTQTAVTSGPIQGNGTAGNPITFQPGTAAGQTWVWNGTAWTLGTAPGDNWGTQTAVTSGPIQGNGTAGNPITFQPGTAAGQTWVWNGTAWTLGTAPGDNWGTQTAVTSGPIQGNGTAGNPITLQAGTAPGQILVWTGTAWTTSTPAVRNGLSFVLTPTPAIELGGSLIKNTDINLGGYVLTASGNGRVGIGLTSPSTSSKVHIRNTDITGGPGVLIEQQSTGATHGLSVFTNSSTTGTAAIRGEHLNTTGGVYGVAGTVSSTSTSSAGVFGQSTGRGFGVYGINTSRGHGVYGIANHATASDGVGVVATHSHNEGAGLIAIGGAITTPTAILGLGTLGEAIDAVGRRIGIWGDASEGGTAAKVGVWGTAGAFAPGTPTRQVGVFGQYSYEGVGVQGQAWTLVGLGSIYSPPAGYTDVGVYGSVGNAAIFGGVAGLFDWDVDIGGTMTAASKSFLIDHPQKPATHYLRHFCAEGPEPNTLYRGTVTLNAQGEAIVELPRYFEALNADFSYHLTCIGDYAPVYIKQKIQGNRFVIAGGKPGMEVSWLVIARRNDPYWQARPEEHLVEIPKEPDNIGKYLHPELYGAPRSQRAAYRRGHTLEEIRAYKEAHAQKPTSRNLKTYEEGNRFRR
jgi:hypothetical protein